MRRSRSGRSDANVASVSRRSGRNASSASRKAMKSPEAANAPAFFAAATPPCSLRIVVSREPNGASDPSEVVGRAVVADEDLEGRIRLRQGRLDRLSDRVRGLVGGDHDGERRPACRLLGAQRRRCEELRAPLGQRDAPGFHSGSSRPSASVRRAGEDEQEVGEPVQVAERRGVDGRLSRPARRRGAPRAGRRCGPGEGAQPPPCRPGARSCAAARGAR